MNTIDENEVPKPPSMSKPILVTMGINLGLLLLVGLLSKLSDMDGEGGVVLYAFWIVGQAAICLLAGIIVTAASPKTRNVGIGLLLSVAVIMLIGFGSCLAFYA